MKNLQKTDTTTAHVVAWLKENEPKMWDAECRLRYNSVYHPDRGSSVHTPTDSFAQLWTNFPSIAIASQGEMIISRQNIPPVLP